VGQAHMQFGQTVELQLCERLGAGAFSKVFRVGDCELAAKVFNEKSTDDSVHEAKMLARVAGSDHVVRLHGLFVATGFLSEVPTDLLLMEQCGASFRNELEQTGPVSERRSGEVLLGLLAALEHIHSRGILHRDVKPDNILFALKDNASSSATSAWLPAPLTRTSSGGAPGYIAPELISGKAGSDKIDVFAAGVVLFIALTMQHPFSADKDFWKLDTLYKEVNVDCLSGCLPDGGFRCCLLAQLLLQKDPDCRPSAKVARSDFWFRRLSVPECCLLPSSDMPVPRPRRLSAPAMFNDNNNNDNNLGLQNPAPAPRSLTSKLSGAMRNVRKLVTW
ncbi:unnamed protein product, partial [Polarella glacialis]